MSQMRDAQIAWVWQELALISVFSCPCYFVCVCVGDGGWGVGGLERPAATAASGEVEAAQRHGWRACWVFGRRLGLGAWLGAGGWGLGRAALGLVV